LNTLDAIRAIEIISDPNLIDVVYNESHIYIQNVNKQNGTASIYHLENPENKQEVSLSDLVEN